jgi:thiamine biosynthesis protein ThiS
MTMVRINNRDEIPWKSGMTIRDVLTAMGYDYPLITVTLNNSLVPQDDYDSRLVPDSSAVVVFHLAHGG